MSEKICYTSKKLSLEGGFFLMLETPLFEQKLKRIRLKIEEGQEGEALETLDSLSAETSSKEERDIIFTRAWYFAHKEQWDKAVELLSPYYNPEEIEANWHAASLKERERRAIYLLWLGNAAVNFSYYEDAAHYFSQCLKVLSMRRVHLPQVQVQALLGFATSCIPLGLFPSAIQHYEKALQVSMKERLTEELPHIYYGLADAHRLAGHFGEAYRFGKLALKIYQENGDRYHECRMLNLLGRVAYHLGDYRASADYYMESLSIATMDNYAGMLLINFVAMGDLRLDEGRFDEAREYCERAQSICSAIQEDNHVCGIMYMISGKVDQVEASQHQGQQASALLEEALAYYTRARSLFKRTQAHAYLAEINGRLAEVYEALDRPEEALACWKYAFAAGAHAQSATLDE
jgi:tetratricopeptide (TPR) repeat protein